MKKIGITFLTLVTLLISLLTLAPSVFAAIEETYPFELNVVYGEGEGKIYTPSNLGIYPYGTKASISIEGLNEQSAVDNKSFAFWVYNGEMINDPNHEFFVTTKTLITAIFTADDEIVAVFLDTNGQLLAVDYLAEPGVPSAPSTSGLSKPGYEAVPFEDLNPIEDHTIYFVEYQLTNPENAVTINGIEYPYNSIVTLEATNPNFKYWEEDGVVVSYNPTYKFSALYNRTIVEKTTNTTPKSMITLTNDLGLRSSEGKATYLGQYELHDDEIFIEAGIIGSYSYFNGELNLETSDVVVLKSNAIQPNTNEFLRTIDADEFAIIRGYLITSEGVYYSEQYSDSLEGLMIFEAYGGGGNNGANYKNDFIVLFNGTNKPINLSGFSVQYASSAGSSWQVTPISGVLNPDNYYIIQEAAGNNGTTSLPKSDATGNISMGASNFKLALVKSTTALNDSDPTSNPLVIDFLGAGTANAYEGSGPSVAGSNTESVRRKVTSGIPQDTDNNSLDFEKTHQDNFFDFLPEFVKYSVSFETNGGNNISIQFITNGNQAIQPSNPTKNGFTFGGWYSDSSFNNAYDFDTPVTTDITLYAKWVVTVTFNLGGGVGNETTEPQILEINDYAIAPNQSPTRNGFDFVGWYDAPTDGSEWEFETTPITTNTTIYAIWESQGGGSIVEHTAVIIRTSDDNTNINNGTNITNQFTAYVDGLKLTTNNLFTVTYQRGDAGTYHLGTSSTENMYTGVSETTYQMRLYGDSKSGPGASLTFDWSIGLVKDVMVYGEVTNNGILRINGTNTSFSGTPSHGSALNLNVDEFVVQNYDTGTSKAPQLRIDYIVVIFYTLGE